MTIHPTAVIDPKAEIDGEVERWLKEAYDRDT